MENVKGLQDCRDHLKSTICSDVIGLPVNIAMVVIGVQVSDENKIKMKYE